MQQTSIAVKHEWIYWHKAEEQARISIRKIAKRKHDTWDMQGIELCNHAAFAIPKEAKTSQTWVQLPRYAKDSAVMRIGTLIL